MAKANPIRGEIPQCTATAKSTGQRCKRRPPPGKTVCKWHGGLSTGPKTPRGKRRSSANGITHGLYAKNYTAADIAFVSGNEDELIQSLDAELILAKVHLNRALAEASRVMDDPKMLAITDSHTSREIGQTALGKIDKMKTEIKSR